MSTQPRLREEADAVVAAATAGDEAAFSTLVDRYRRELHVHCYRMLGSLEDAEDLVQETFLRAWRSRSGFSREGRWSFRAWLYRIATNACLDAVAKRPRRVLASHLGPPADPLAQQQPEPADLPWLQPYPDHLLEGIAPAGEEPEAAVVARETIEIAFLAALQLLPPRQRAALILREVLGWSAKETAALLDTSVPSVNSALQRARATLDEELPARRLGSPGVREPTAAERAVLKRFMDAFEQADLEAIARLMHEDVHANMPPFPFWFRGRDANMTALAMGHDPASPGYAGEWRCVPTGANLQPAAAFYLRRPGDTEYRAFAVDVLRVEDGQVTEITAFVAEGLPYVFPAFDLPATI